jgi:hypothetical protein
MNVEIGAEAALFPEKEYINGIAVAVQQRPFFYLCTFRKDLPWMAYRLSFPFHQK